MPCGRSRWAIGLGLSTLLTILFGELVPKNLAIARPMKTAPRHPAVPARPSPPLNLWPIRFLNGSANAIVRRMGIEPQEELRSARSSTELASLIARSADQGTLDAETAELIERSVEFGHRTAGEIMTPRVRTTSVEENDRASTVIELARETGHSRFPVLDDEDVVVGTVHVKHAVALPVTERATTRIKHIMVRPIDGSGLTAARPAAGAAARGRLPDGGRARRVRRPRRHRHPRGRRRGDRRRHRRRARPAQRRGQAATRRGLVAVGTAAPRRGRGPDRDRPARARGLRHHRRARAPGPGPAARRWARPPRFCWSPCPPRTTTRSRSQRTAVLRVEKMDGRRIDRVDPGLSAPDRRATDEPRWRARCSRRCCSWATPSSSAPSSP